MLSSPASHSAGKPANSKQRALIRKDSGAWSGERCCAGKLIAINQIAEAVYFSATYASFLFQTGETGETINDYIAVPYGKGQRSMADLTVRNSGIAGRWDIRTLDISARFLKRGGSDAVPLPAP